MIAADTSAWIDYFKGAGSPAALKLEQALVRGDVVMPEPVLFELLSGPKMPADARALLIELPRLEQKSGFWERSGELRRALLKKGHKAHSMDCLIAQSCMDQQVVLIAADGDFKKFDGLSLA